MESLDIRKRQRFLQHLFTYTAKSVIFNLILAVLITIYYLLTQVSLVKVWSWFAILAGLAAIRFTVSVIGQKAQTQKHINLCYTILIISGFFLGVLWGYLYWLAFYEMNMFQKMFLLLIIAGLASGITVSLASSYIAFYSFILPLLFPVVALNLMIISDINAVAIIAVVVIFFCFLVVVHTENNKMLEANIDLLIQQIELNKQLKHFNKKLSIVSVTDELTNLVNRRYFRERLISDWVRAKRSKIPMSLILIDIDYFKQCNDHYGHLYGDECLKQVAKLIHQQVNRETDLAARLGGDELAIILYDTPEKGAVKFSVDLQKKLKGLKIKNELSEISEEVTVSIGIASMIPAISDAHELLFAHADKALYEAKNKGRNQIVVYQK